MVYSKQAAGMPRIISATDLPSGVPFAYHRTIDGVRLELIDLGRSAPDVASYLGGAFDDLLREGSPSWS
ncbi:hypothetical protein [Nocardia terpenica]|uniref:Uncharacterized protein n=1 Tax=Nocardia terpenica TaxID=455432 RepID=A0A6G9Z421_9NOCA|nr:hypothetical protein [Nocardia terpenica]QIS20355.1 hypothetical protein F6W96_20710 [Nocardia terpenica]